MTAEEYAHIATEFVMPPPSKRIWPMILGGGLAASGLILGLREPRMQLMMGVWVGYGLAIFIRYATLRFEVRRLHMSVSHKPENRAMFENLSIEFDDLGIGTRHDDGQFSWYPWKRILKVEQKLNGYVLNLTGLAFIWIPDRAFADREHFERILRDNRLAF